MDLQDFKDLADRILYKGKPCFKVKSYDPRNSTTVPALCPDGYVYVSVWIEAICVKDCKPTQIEVGGLMSIREIESQSVDSHLTFVKDQICMLELHEVQEVLTLDGLNIFDPHDLKLNRKAA